MSRNEPVYRYIDHGHILTAGFGVILIGFVGALLLVGRDGLDFRVLHVSAYTPIIIVLYLVAIRAAFVYERRSASPPAMLPDEKITLRAALARYLLAAVVVAGAGAWLPFVGLEIAETMGWRTTFVGTLFVAAATSLPELVVTITAFRLGAADMAIANLLGSNLFNMFIVAIDDIAYTGGPLLSAASPTHAVSAFAAVIMSGIFIVALLFRPETRFRGTIGWVSLSLLLVYVLSAYAIYLHGH
jgi:cation:H+ antiporter